MIVKTQKLRIVLEKIVTTVQIPRIRNMESCYFRDLDPRGQDTNINVLSILPLVVVLFGMEAVV